MPSLPEFVAFEGSAYDAPKDRVVVTLSTRRGVKYNLGLGSGCLGALVVSLLGRGRDQARAHTGQDYEAPPLRLTGAEPLLLKDGTAGLLVRLQTDLHFTLSLTSASIASLRTALLALENITRSSEGYHH